MAATSSFSPAPYITLLRHTQIPLPDVRRQTLIESVRRASSEDDVLDIFLDAATNSPYLSTEHKNQLAHSLLSRKMSQIAQASDSPSSGTANSISTDKTDSASNNNNNSDHIITPELLVDYNDEDTAFCAMARLIFSRSRKLQRLPVDRRRQILIALHQARSTPQIVDLVLQRLPDAMSLDGTERQLVAADILDHRYYRLLLPDRFHCEEPHARLGTTTAEEQRKQETQDEQGECPICLEDFAAFSSDSAPTVLLCCRQKCCPTCIAAWLEKSAECPLCRSALVTAGGEAEEYCF